MDKKTIDGKTVAIVVLVFFLIITLASYLLLEAKYAELKKL